MNVIAYLKEKGVKRALQVLYRYKLHHMLCKLILPFVKNRPLKDTIVIESHNDFDNNGGAFYEFLIENGYNKRYKIVWLLKNKRPKGKLPENVIALKRFAPGIRKAYHVCTAKYLTADNEVTDKTRPEQLSLYLTHGAVGLKSIRSMNAYMPESVDHILCPSENWGRIQAEELHLPFDRRFAKVGLPHLDTLFKDAPGDLRKLTDKHYRKVFVWMPTFRKGGGFRRNDSEVEQPYGIPLVETEEDMEKIQAFLEENNCLLIIKIHPMQDPSTLKKLHGSENIRVLTGKTVKELGVDNYRLIKDADAVISDYSSIIYSFLLLDRPMGFVLSDLKDYKLGLCVDDPEKFLCGPKIYNFEDFFGFLTDVCNGRDAYAEHRRELIPWIYDYQDGNNCQRLAAFMGLEK